MSQRARRAARRGRGHQVHAARRVQRHRRAGGGRAAAPRRARPRRELRRCAAAPGASVATAVPETCVGCLLVVRLLEAFEEQGVVCLVLELLGDAVLDVSRWGPWRQPMQEQTRRSPASARRHKLHAAVGASAPRTANAASPIPATTSSLPPVTPLPLDEVRQVRSPAASLIVIARSLTTVARSSRSQSTSAARSPSSTTRCALCTCPNASRRAAS